jgi:hypothetical protein
MWKKDVWLMRRVRLRLGDMEGRCLFNEEVYVKAWKYGRQM